MAAFHGYTLRPEDTVDTASARLTTIQTDIRSMNQDKAPSDQAKSIKLMDLFVRRNRRYEPIVLLLQGRDPFPAYQDTMSALARIEERITLSDKENGRGPNLALSANFRAKGKGRGIGSQGHPPKRTYYHCGSKEHFRAACPKWLATPEGTKWSAKNPRQVARNRNAGYRPGNPISRGSNPNPRGSSSRNPSNGAWAAFTEGA